MTSETQRIIVFGSLPPPITGQALVFSELVHALVERNTPLTVVSQPRQGKKIGFSIRRLFRYPAPIGRVLWASARASSATVYMIMGQSLAGFIRDALFTYGAKLRGHRVIGHFHSGNYDLFYRRQPAFVQWLIRRTLRRVDVIVLLSERLIPMLHFEPQVISRTAIVPNPSLVGPEQTFVKELLGDPLPPVRVLFLSNLIESKGYLDVVRAVGILLHEYHLAVECVLAGAFFNNSDDVLAKQADPRELLRRTIAEAGAESAVHYVGVVDGERSFNC